MTEEDLASTFAPDSEARAVALEDQSIVPLDVSRLDTEQFQAFDIIRQHLDQTLAGKNPPPLRMITYGEGGTGKSQVIQTVTDYFDNRQVSRLLLKAAFTGIAASLIKGKTTHYIGQISFKEMDMMTNETRKKLEKIWRHASYLIIDEFSMISKTFLARLSRAIDIGVHGSRPSSPCSFGGINVILFGDLHQFPPVVTKARESLFYPIHISDTHEAKIGRMIYEEFKTVVILKQQHQIKDVPWRNFLRHLRKGTVTDRDRLGGCRRGIGHPSSCAQIVYHFVVYGIRAWSVRLSESHAGILESAFIYRNKHTGVLRRGGPTKVKPVENEDSAVILTSAVQCSDGFTCWLPRHCGSRCSHFRCEECSTPLS